MKESLPPADILYKALFEEARDALFLADAETGVIVDCNAEACRLIGRTKAEIVGMPQYMLHPEADKPLPGKSVTPTFERHATDMLGWVLQGQVVRVDGTLRDVEIKTSLIEVWGRRLLQGMFRDITEQKEALESLKSSEEKFRALFDTASDAIAIHDLEGHFLEVNQVWCDKLGYTRQDLLRLTPMDLDTPEYGRQVPERIRQILEEGELIFETVQVRKNGTSIPMEIHARAITFDGKPAICSLIRDITLRKKTEAALQRAREERESTARIKSQFLANMSHEIRTPLNGIVGMIDLITEGDQDEERRRLLGIMKQCSDNLVAIVNNILELAKIEAGEIIVERRRFNIVSLIEEVCFNHLVSSEMKGLEMLHVIDDDVPKFVMGDRFRITQVLNNLLSNACKFTDEGGCVVLHVRLDSEEEAQYCFDVIDSGPGISKDKVGAIFESFAQADTSLTRRYGGTGLGLTIAKRLAEVLGGVIDVRSIEGTGSVFTFKCPLPQPVAGEDPKGCKSVKEEPLSPRILVVDDNAMNLLVTKRLLEHQGFVVEEAEDGRCALNMLEAATGEKSYDAVLMDCQMPILDGYETTKLIRKLNTAYSCIPIIALTAHALHGDRERCIESGMNDYIAKPVSSVQLVDILQKWITVPDAKR